MPDMPHVTLLPGAEGFVHQVDDAPAYWGQDILWIMLADANDTGGRWSMMEQEMPKGAGPSPHRHLWSDETFYLLDGTITFLIGDEVRTAHKGAFVMISRSVRHGFRVDSDTARILNGYTPASWEAMIAENFERTDQHTLPPPGPVMTGGEMPEAFVTRYGLIWLDEPDPLEPRGHR